MMAPYDLADIHWDPTPETVGNLAWFQQDHPTAYGILSVVLRAASWYGDRRGKAVGR